MFESVTKAFTWHLTRYAKKGLKFLKQVNYSLYIILEFISECLKNMYMRPLSRQTLLLSMFHCLRVKWLSQTNRQTEHWSSKYTVCTLWVQYPKITFLLLSNVSSEISISIIYFLIATKQNEVIQWFRSILE